MAFSNASKGSAGVEDSSAAQAAEATSTETADEAPKPGAAEAAPGLGAADAAAGTTSADAEAAAETEAAAAWRETIHARSAWVIVQEGADRQGAKAAEYRRRADLAYDNYQDAYKKAMVRGGFSPVRPRADHGQVSRLAMVSARACRRGALDKALRKPTEAEWRRRQAEYVGQSEGSHRELLGRTVEVEVESEDVGIQFAYLTEAQAADVKGLFSEAAEASFGNIAVQADGAAEKAMQKPGVEGLHVFLEGCRADAASSGASAEAVTVESLKKVFAERGWPIDKSFTRADLTTLLESPGDAGSGGEELAEDISTLVDELHSRAAAKEFPLIRPIDLRADDEQNAAEQAMSLFEKLDAVQIQSYIDYQKEQYFNNSPGDPATSIDEKHALWALNFYYKHVRDFLAKQPLDARTFAHRFAQSTFIPLISPQSIGDGEKPELLESLDKNLWSAWEEIAEVVELSGAGAHDSFREFLEEDYFRIVRETCDAGARQNAGTGLGATVAFRPMVDPGFGVSAGEADERKTLLLKVDVPLLIFRGASGGL
ncbi:unnamed protein product [Prorocentrum cordatum]|uniref:Uncharacterized protein n=1 Tax=Prorocentrum cordatum TaxID=2364126 RepID=A0ABN9RUW3_9DINO|nr:unnamed protein product [Polarella glacialis]